MMDWEDIWLVGEYAGALEIRKYKAVYHPEHRQWIVKVSHSMREAVPEGKVCLTEARAKLRLELVRAEKVCTKCGATDASLINDGDDGLGPVVCTDCYDSGVEPESPA